MKKKELIEAMEFLNDDEEVYIARPTGDYWGHVKIVPVEAADTIDAIYSSYTESLISVDSDEEIEREDGKVKNVFILS